MKKTDIKLSITEDKILYQLEKRPLGTGELVKKLEGKDDETILLNCRKLVEKGLIYDKPTKKGKYTLVENPKLPAFLMYRARNRSLKVKILNDIFSSKNNENMELFDDDFVKNMGIYISYVLLEATRPGGPWTVNWIKSSNDPRMQDIDLLRETWLDDMIDQEQFFEQFLSLKNNTDYQELVKKFESSFPDIYNKIRFHEGIAQVRKLQKQNRKRMNEPQTERSDEEIYGEYETGYLDASDRKNKNKIKSD